MEKDRIYKRLADIRGDMDLTQKEIAQKLNIKTSMYSKWEREIEIMPLQRVHQFSNLSGYSIDYIAGLTNQNKKNDLKMEISKSKAGERLREFRKINNMTQKDLALFLNTSQSVISAYENGKFLILSAFLYQIARKYKVSMDWLCGLRDDKNI